MKKFPALAVLEFDSVPSGLYVADVMVKESPLSLFKAGTISRGRFMVLVGGSTAAVEIALDEAAHAAGGAIADQVFLADIHDGLHDAVLGFRIPPSGAALAVLETRRTPCNIQAVEYALKGTDCRLLEVRLADAVLDGKGVSLFEGELHDVEAAIELATRFLADKGHEHEAYILTAPHEATLRQVARTTRFHDVSDMDLSGEPYNPEICHAYR